MVAKRVDRTKYIPFNPVLSRKSNLGQKSWWSISNNPSQKNKERKKTINHLRYNLVLARLNILKRLLHSNLIYSQKMIANIDSFWHRSMLLCRKVVKTCTDWELFYVWSTSCIIITGFLTSPGLVKRNETFHILKKLFPPPPQMCIPPHTLLLLACWKFHSCVRSCKKLHFSRMSSFGRHSFGRRLLKPCPVKKVGATERLSEWYTNKAFWRWISWSQFTRRSALGLYEGHLDWTIRFSTSTIFEFQTSDVSKALALHVGFTQRG